MKLRIMSNNIWWCDSNRPEWESQGLDCSAAYRAQGLYRMYQETMPDIIGLQECSARMAHQLMVLFAQNDDPYTLIWGRDTPIVYRRDKFELVDSRVHIYPEEVPGLEGHFNNLNTKSYCIAVLRNKESGQLLVFASTHLWYKSDASQPFSEDAKAWQLERLMDAVETLREVYRAPAVIVGDLNTWPTGKAVQAALRRGFAHAHDAATECTDETSGMHRCDGDGYDTFLREGGFARSLDHIFIQGALTVRRFARYCPDYYFPLSDHSPAWIDAEF